MTHGQRDRQNYITDLVAAERPFGRADLCDTFGISPTQATIDIQAWIAAHPGSLSYDTRRKRYVPSGVLGMEPRPVTALRSIRMEQAYWDLAAEAGDGNASEGIRRALLALRDRP